MSIYFAYARTIPSEDPLLRMACNRGRITEERKKEIVTKRGLVGVSTMLAILVVKN